MRTSITIMDRTDGWLRELAALTLTGRGGTAGIAATMLDALPGMLSAELRRVPLSVGEASLLADVHNSTILDLSVTAGSGSLVAWGLRDATEGIHPVTGEPLARDFERHHDLPEGQVDQLTARLDTLGPTADLALRIALARWWASGEREATAAGFSAVGLRVV